jgi:hypothetical protein
MASTCFQFSKPFCHHGRVCDNTEERCVFYGIQYMVRKDSFCSHPDIVGVLVSRFLHTDLSLSTGPGIRRTEGV